MIGVVLPAWVFPVSSWLRNFDRLRLLGWVVSGLMDVSMEPVMINTELYVMEIPKAGSDFEVGGYDPGAGGRAGLCLGFYLSLGCCGVS